MWVFGDEENGFYSSGRFAGETKWSVFFQRRLPGWAGVKAILDTPRNNHYFKVGQNFNGMVNTKERAEDLKNLLNL